MKRTSRKVKKPFNNKILEEVGRVVKYYSKIKVAVVKLNKSVKLGDKIVILSKNGETKFSQKIGSIHHYYKPISKARSGMEVGLKVDRVVDSDDVVLKLKL